MTVDRVAACLGVRPQGADTIVSTCGRDQLPRLFADLGYRRGAEIGVWDGAFSECLVRGMPDIERLYSVDPWIAYRRYNEKKNVQARMDKAYARTVQRLTGWPCEILRMMSTEAATRIPDGSLDFVYIDANHAEAFVRQDLAAWVPKVRRGGCVSGHDYEVTRPRSHAHSWIEVKPAVDAYVRDHQIAPLFVLSGDKAPSWLWVQA